MSLDGLSLSTLLAELNSKLTGGRIDKIFQTDKYTLTMWIRQPTQNLCLLISVDPQHPRMHLIETPPENPTTPPAFSMLLRKHIEGGRIAEIGQHSLDRIAFLSIDTRGEEGVIVTKSLTIELMGKHSNIILTHDNMIIDAIKRIGISTSRHRQVLPKMEYSYPPGQMRLNLLTTPTSDFITALTKNPIGLVTKGIVNTGIGIGPVTAREIVWRAGLPANITLDHLDKGDLIALSEAIESMITHFNSDLSSPTVMVNADNGLSGIASFPLEHLTQTCTPHHFSTMSEAVLFVDGLSRIQRLPEQSLLLKLTTDEINRLLRKQIILTQEQADAIAADESREYGDLLMANLYNISNGSNSITLPNLYRESPDNNLVTILLDPRLSPLENARAYYTKYNKLKRAQESLREQLIQCAQDIAYLDSIVAALEHASLAAELLDIRLELTHAGYIKPLSKRRIPTPPSMPLMTKTSDGLTILVGKNNRQNDIVTFKQSQPNDLWFHTKDIPGSHVILRTSTQEPSLSAIETAAHLAAYYSKAGQSTKVPVDYTKRRYVKKPSGSKPGFVIYDHQHTIYVTPDKTKVDALVNTKR
ncbi:NFACT family protein [Pelosinus sp. sgz500959]|uniref:Rqc2 family fibronectin-binding protein n=1 Tax=Pelosinus sp. sgz500959 TaxID=3242472 RepID=UPI00366A9337